MDRWSTRFRSFDIFPKYVEDVKVKTFTGGAVSICAALLIFVLIISEFMLYFSPEVIDRLEVDVSRGNPLPIHFDVSFPHIPCPALEVEVTDIANSDMRSLSHYISRTVLLAKGPDHSQRTQYILGSGNLFKSTSESYCGSCYGALAAEACCSTCDSVLDAYKKRKWHVQSIDIFEQCLREREMARKLFRNRLARNEGCRVVGRVLVPKVGGHFKFIVSDILKAKNSQLVKDIASVPPSGADYTSDVYATHRWQNMSHTIHSIRFGEEYEGIADPLKETSKFINSDTESASFLYYLKVVPTRYKNKVRGELKDTNQYSVTEYQMTSQMPETISSSSSSSASATAPEGSTKLSHLSRKSTDPTSKDDQATPVPNGAFFFYELSPIRVRVTEKSRSFAHLVTQLCAIVGGVFTVAGLVDRFVYAGVQYSKRRN